LKLVALNTNVFERTETTELDGQDASEVVLLEIERREASEVFNGGRKRTTETLVLFNTQIGQARQPSEVGGDERTREIEILQRQIINDSFVLTAAKERIQRTGGLARSRVDAAVLRGSGLVGQLCAQRIWTRTIARRTANAYQQARQCGELRRGRRTPRRAA